MSKYFIILLLIIQIKIVYCQESVVCLHGFFRSYRCMIPMANTFRNEGFDVYLWDYPSRKKTIEEHAESLVEVLNAIAQKNPSQPIHFVTHSLGGIIVRVAMQHPDCPIEAKKGKAVLLAPPNQGSQLARTFHGCPTIRWIFGKKAGYQLLTYNKEHMRQLGQFPDTKHVLVVAGAKESPFFRRWVKEPNDGKVTVNETRLNTPHHHHVLHVSHSWIMTSRKSISLTKEFITKQLPSQCGNDSQLNGPAESVLQVETAPSTF